MTTKQKRQRSERRQKERYSSMPYLLLTHEIGFDICCDVCHGHIHFTHTQIDNLIYSYSYTHTHKIVKFTFNAYCMTHTKTVFLFIFVLFLFYLTQKAYICLPKLNTTFIILYHHTHIIFPFFFIKLMPDLNELNSHLFRFISFYSAMSVIYDIPLHQ